MKKLFPLLVLVFITAIAIGQNIDNTLGSDGSFNINKSDATNLFKIATSDTEDHVLRLPNSQAVSFQIQNSTGLPVLSFGDYLECRYFSQYDHW